MTQEEMHAETLQKEPQTQLSIASASPAVARFMEILLCMLCLCLIAVPYDNGLFLSVHKAGFVYTSFIMPVVVDIIIIISHLRGQPPSKLAMCIFSGLFGFLLVVSGAVIMKDWNTILRRPHSHPAKMFMDMMICSGIFAVFTSLISFSNVYLTYKFL